MIYELFRCEPQGGATLYAGPRHFVRATKKWIFRQILFVANDDLERVRSTEVEGITLS